MILDTVHCLAAEAQSAVMVIPWVRLAVVRRRPLGAELLADHRHRDVELTDRAAARTVNTKPIVTKLGDVAPPPPPAARRDGWRRSSSLASPAPALAAALHIPPAIYNVFATHMGNFARPLSGEQDQLTAPYRQSDRHRRMLSKTAVA